MRPRAAVLLAPLALALAVPAPTALAQAQAEPELPVALSLVGQTLVATPSRPLQLTVTATNQQGPALRDLTLTLWIYHPSRSRSEYRLGLVGEPPTEPLLITPFPQRGLLRPGETREIAVSRDLGELAGRGNAVYPLKVQLESEGVAVGVLRSALLFIAERPLVPLNVALTFVLDEPVRFRPDGVFVTNDLARSIAPGGRLETILAALEEQPVRSTLVVSPILLEQLSRMGRGYRVLEAEGPREVPAEAPEAERAVRFLERLRELARSSATEVVALPYASPSVPSLAVPGLAPDLAAQLELGRARVESILGVAPVPSVFRPPGSDITREALPALAEAGIRTLLLDAETAPPPAGLPLSPPATATLPEGMAAVTPDPGLEALLTPPRDQARLWAQQLLGELASIYLEQPSVVRGVAILFDEPTTLQPAFLRPLLRGLADPPPRTRWARPAKTTQLLTATPPEEQGRRRLRPAPAETFSPAFVAAVAAAKEAIDQFTSMAGPLDLEDRLRTMLLVAESRDFLRRESAGREFLAAVRDILEREFRKVEPPAGTSVTLTSRGGVIPVTLRKEADYDVRVRVTLLSPRLEFLEGASREVLLARDAQALTFPVRAQTTGRFPVTIRLETPGGRTIAESQIVVRSTAYNRVALFVTIGAAAFLALWWGRRFLRRARS